MTQQTKRINRATTRVNRGERTAKMEIYGKPEKTQEGFLVVPVIIAKKMVLDYPEYGTRELMGDDIFSDDFLKSCDGCPFVLDHPKDGEKPIDITPDNYEKLLKGVLYDPQIDKENNRVIGKVKIYNPDVIADIENKDLVELSQGYACAVDNKPGEFNGKSYDGEQQGMIMNHLALVENGRAGNFVKVLYNNSGMSLAAADLERIERRRVNMVFTTFKKLSAVTQEKILSRINVAPKDFFRLNTDEQADKIKNEDLTEAEKKEANGADEPDGDEAPKSMEDRMSALEKTMNALSATINKMANGARNDDPPENGMTNDAADGDPEKKEPPKLNDEEKKLENKVNAAARRIIPSMVNEYANEAETAYMQGRALVGESFQTIAARCNGVIPEFRKEVLLIAGEPLGYTKEDVKRMNAAQVAATLDVLARNAKLSILDARRNSHRSYHTDSGDVVVKGHNGF